MAIKVQGTTVIDDNQGLRITGVSTFTNGPVFIGAATSTGTASQRLQVTGGAYISGNLGIGTTNPTAKLEPVDTAGNPSVAPVVFIQRPNNIVPASIAPTNADLRIKSHSSNVKIYAEDHSANPLMILTGNGNLGIGTTNPLVPLHVLGNFLVAAGTSTGQHITQKAYELNSGTLSWEGTAGQLFSITNNLTSGSIFSVNDVSGIPSVDVNADGTVTLAPYADGNVGIATTRPTSRLHVVGNALITGIATVNSNLVVNGNTLYADATNNRVGIGTTNPLSILQVQSPSAFTTFGSGGNLVPNGLYVNNPSSGFTYPTTASFQIHPGILNNLTLDTSQTINSSTPGGFNFVYPLRNRIAITTATTSTDLTRLYINAIQSEVSWASTAPTTQIIGLNDDITFGGSSISAANCVGSFTLAGISSSTQTATTINSSGLFVSNATTTNRIRNVTTWRGYNANLNIGQGTGAGNTTTITTAEYFTNTGSNTIQAGGTGSSTLITNLYGLRLGTPSISGIVTITNNWGVYQEWSSQSNYFSGNTLIGSATSTGTASQPLQVTGGAYVSGSIGIGTTSPQYKVDVLGKVYISEGVGLGTTNANSSLEIYGNGTNNWNAITLSGNSLNDSSPKGSTIRGKRYNNLNIPFNAFGAWDDGTNRMVYLGGGDWNSPDSTRILFYTTNYTENINTASVRMEIDSGGTVLIGGGSSTGTANQKLQVTGGAYVSGNLGIGSIQPEAKLDVIGNVKISSDLNVSGVSTFAGITTSTSSLFANNLSVSGISTFAGIATHTASLFGTQASFTGVSTSGGFNATTGNTYQIAGTTVLNNNTLGSGVVNSSLTSVGTLGQLNVSGVSTFAGITTVTGSTLFSRQISASGVSTFSGISTFQASLFGTTASFTGVSTSGGFNATTGNTYQIAGTTVLSNNTLGSGVVNSSLTSVGTLGQLNVSGVSTFAGIATHTASLFGTQASFTGVSTFAGIATHTASLFGTQASFTGVSTFNNTLNVVPTSTSIGGLFSGTTSSDMVRITQLGTGNALVVEDSANPDSSPFVVGAGGSVGVGTTNPQYIFTVTDTGTPATTGLTNCLADFTTTANSYGQINLRNTSTGTNASSDIIVTADNGSDTTNFIDLGINNSAYSVGSWTINGANDGYLYTSDGNLSIGAINASVPKYISFFTGGTLISNERMRINATGVGIGTTNPNYALEVRGGIGATTLVVSGVSTFAGIATHTASLFGTQASFTGVSTSGGFNATTGNTYQIAGTTVLSNNTLGSGVVNSSLTSVGTLGQLNVSGVSTFSGIATHTASLFGTQASFTGIVTASSFRGDGSQLTGIVATGLGTLTQLSVSGVSTFAGIATHTASLFGTTASFTGIVTASSFRGDGSQLTGISASGAITVRDEGNTVGTAGSVTSLNFIGGNIVATASGVGATITISNNLVGTALSITGISTFTGITTVSGSLFSNQASVSGVVTSGTHNVTSGNTYQIAGTTVLSNNTLGSGVVNSSLTSVGTLGQLNVSGVSTFSGIATHTASLFGTQASFTGVSTFAGIATHTASLFGTQASFTGVSTFSNGPVLIGAATSTGTASQRLQVTGGAYVSGNIGAAVTSPSFAVDVSGDARVQSTGKMRFGGTAGTTNFYIQYNSTANSLDFVAG